MNEDAVLLLYYVGILFTQLLLQNDWFDTILLQRDTLHGIMATAMDQSNRRIQQNHQPTVRHVSCWRLIRAVWQYDRVLKGIIPLYYHRAFVVLLPWAVHFMFAGEVRHGQRHAQARQNKKK